MFGKTEYSFGHAEYEAQEIEDYVMQGYQQAIDDVLKHININLDDSDGNQAWALGFLYTDLMRVGKTDMFGRTDKTLPMPY